MAWKTDEILSGPYQRESMFRIISKDLVTTGTEKMTASDCGQFTLDKSILSEKLIFGRNTEVIIKCIQSFGFISN